MRVLVYQQMHAGHNYYYLHYLLPRLLEMTQDIVVAITPEGRASEEFATLLGGVADRVTVAPVLPSGHLRVVNNQPWRLHTDLREAVVRYRPAYVFAPTGDAHTERMGLFRLAGRPPLPGNCPGEAGIHLGLSDPPATVQQTMRDRLHRLKLRTSGWTRLHLVNALFYERISAAGGSLAARCALLPHPVQPNTNDQAESRRQLGLPPDGRIVGVSGIIDYRKAVRELLTAFRQAAPRPTDRVLLAGPIEPRHHATLAEHEDLIRSGRLLVLDRFFDAESTRKAMSAMDIICTPYPGFTWLSSVLLEALAAGRPILANRQGWCRMIVDRFQAGWTCDVTNPADFAAAMRAALEGCESYTPSEATSRLLQFHSPENFAASFLEGVRTHAGLPGLPVRSWPWVLEAVGQRS
jgi:glycosyltransferase involved in cell wall biosynthesis